MPSPLQQSTVHSREQLVVLVNQIGPSLAQAEIDAMVALVQNQQAAAGKQRERYVIERLGQPSREDGHRIRSLELQLAEAQGQLKALRTVIEDQFRVALAHSTDDA